MATINLTDIGLPTKVVQTKYVNSWDNLSLDDRRHICLYYQYLWKTCAQKFLEVCLDTVRDSLTRCVQEEWNGIKDKRFVTGIRWSNSDNDILEQFTGFTKISQSFLVLDTEDVEKLNSASNYSVPLEASYLDLIVVSYLEREQNNDITCCWGFNDENTLTEFHVNGAIPLEMMTFVIPNFLENIVQKVEKESKTVNTSKKKESLLESELYDWLILNSVSAFRQAKKTTGNVNDIWIPDTMFLELKRGSVTGNDVCQAIEYYSESKVPVVLVGDKITTKASKGLKGFNAICKESVVFVDWSCIKDYLKGRLEF